VLSASAQRDGDPPTFAHTRASRIIEPHWCAVKRTPDASVTDLQARGAAVVAKLDALRPFWRLGHDMKHSMSHPPLVEDRAVTQPASTWSELPIRQRWISAARIGVCQAEILCGRAA
jgi:hypothetical protein